MTHPKKPRRKARDAVIDTALDEKAEALLHMAPALMSSIWQDAAGCALPDCPTCRLGRAMAWLSKASVDIDIAMKVIEAVYESLPDAEKDEAKRAKHNLDLAYVAIRQLNEIPDAIAYWAMSLGHSLGGRVMPPGTLSVEVVDEDEKSMTVTLKRERPNGRAN